MASFLFINGVSILLQWVDETLLMLGFKQRTSGVGRSRSTNWATNTAQERLLFSKTLHHDMIKPNYFKSNHDCCVTETAYHRWQAWTLNSFLAVARSGFRKDQVEPLAKKWVPLINASRTNPLISLSSKSVFSEDQELISSKKMNFCCQTWLIGMKPTLGKNFEWMGETRDGRSFRWNLLAPD